jgi:hypothetical protein
LNTKTKGLPSPSSVCKRSLCAKEDLTDNEHTRGREKDPANDFSSARKSSLFPKNILRERERQNESVDDALASLRALLAINSFQVSTDLFVVFSSGDFFTQTLSYIMNASFYHSRAKTGNVDTPRRLPRRSRERAQKHFSEREYTEEYY